MCFVWIWEQTVTLSLYSINWLVFITDAENVYCAVRTGSSNQTDTHSSLKGKNDISRQVELYKDFGFRRSLICLQFGGQMLFLDTNYTPVSSVFLLLVTLQWPCIASISKWNTELKLSFVDVNVDDDVAGGTEQWLLANDTQPRSAEPPEMIARRWNQPTICTKHLHYTQWRVKCTGPKHNL